jgi:hypothetical protein
MPAWTAGIHRKGDASGNIQVNLGFSTSCWNDVIEGVLLEPTEAIRPVFSNEQTKNMNFIMIKNI